MNISQVSSFPPSSDDAGLREALKRCSPRTLEAACEFRRTGDAGLLPVIVLGLLERYVSREARPLLTDDGVRLQEDLGIDSLSLMEFVMLAEDALQITIRDEELRPLRTVGDVKFFIEDKLRGRV
jgi:acyl carrier protein